ncbi:MAG: hypothetical protein ACK52J_01870 [bacterium]
MPVVNVPLRGRSLVMQISSASKSVTSDGLNVTPISIYELAAMIPS